jgi:hypothetical protein
MFKLNAVKHISQNGGWGLCMYLSAFTYVVLLHGSTHLRHLVLVFHQAHTV